MIVSYSKFKKSSQDSCRVTISIIKKRRVIFERKNFCHQKY